MSIFLPARMTCPACGTVAECDLSVSVNADRRPDLRAAILDGSFQAVACGACGAPVRFPPHLTYIDMGRSQWFLVESAGRLEQWRDVEAEAAELYDTSFGARAPAVQRALMDDVQARLVFGWPALREKLVAAEAGLDDVVLELLKVSALRQVPEPPLADQTELRLVTADAETLHLVWFDSVTERQITNLVLPRELFDALAANLGPWEELRREVSAGLFVDLKRMVFA